MNELKNAFQTSFGIPIPDAWIQGKQLFPIEQGSNLLMGSQLAVREPYLIQGQIAKFLKTSPPGYYLIGFWGHGVNSYAFYYCRVDEKSKVFFRLPYGGVYMDNDQRAKQIREFIVAFLAFEQSAMPTVTELIAVESMGISKYKVVYADGRVVEQTDNFFTDSFF